MENELWRASAKQIADGSDRLQGQRSLATAFELVIENAAEHIAPKGQIEVAGQHPQAGQGLVHRAFAVVLWVAAVVMQPPIPVLESFSLNLRSW